MFDSLDKHRCDLSIAGAFLFNRCQGAMNIEALEALCSKKFSSLHKSRIRPDIEQIISKLISHGLVRIHEHRQLPAFIIPGAQKSGTNAIRFNLKKHPQISMPDREIHFFSREENWNLGLKWYREHFQDHHLLLGEKTPNYLPSTAAATRLNWLMPDVKFVVVLRNPIDRAYSHWNHYNLISEKSANWGWEVVEFEDCLKQKDFVRKNGHYANHLERFFEHFPREQFLILVSERLRSQPEQEFQRICEFLNVEPPAYMFESRHERSYETSMRPTTRRMLAEYYRPEDEKLFQLLGESFPEWSD